MRMTLSLVAALAASLSFACMTAQAAETWTGRWAADSASCSALGASGSMLYASDSSLRFADSSCRIGKIYKVGKSVHIQAHCSEGGENRDISVTLTLQQTSAGERLAVTWGNRAVKDMQRCP
jgi:hypothetical protein